MPLRQDPDARICHFDVPTPEIAERNRQKRLQQQREYMDRAERRSRDNALASLQQEARESSAWRSAVRNSIAYQQRQTLLNELEAPMAPPSPPENLTEVVYVSGDEGSPDFGPDFNPELFNKKRRSWF